MRYKAHTAVAEGKAFLSVNKATTRENQFLKLSGGLQ